ncbi:MAG: GSCFA domain-containing protein [Candidatus Methylacidiphilales bacterium]
MADLHLWSKYPIRGDRFEKSELFMTMGSCFAFSIGSALKRMGVPSSIQRVHEEANSPLLNEQLLDYLLDGKKSETAAQLFADEISEETRADFVSNLKKASGFILTVGVGVYCYETATGRLVIRPNPRDGTDCSWKILPPQEGANSIYRFLMRLRSVNPKLRVIITVSPVALYRSFTTPSAFTEDCLSKSSLRLAVQTVLGWDETLHYWPTFEFFRWFGCHTGPSFGQDTNLAREPNNAYVDIALEAFVRHYFNNATLDASQQEKVELNQNVLVQDVR